MVDTAGWGGDVGRPPKPRPLHGPTAPRAGGTLACPDYLTDEHARDVFDRTAAELRAMGLEASADVDTVAAYAWTVARMADAMAIVDGSSVLSVQRRQRGEHEAPTVTVTGNPAGREFERYFKAMRACATQLGLTPSARTRLANAAAPETSEEDSDTSSAEIVQLIRQAQRDAAAAG